MSDKASAPIYIKLLQMNNTNTNNVQKRVATSEKHS